MENEIIEYNWKPASELLEILNQHETDRMEIEPGSYMKFKFYTNDRSKYVTMDSSEEPLEGELIITSVFYKLVDNKLVVESFDDFVCEPDHLDKMAYTILKN